MTGGHVCGGRLQTCMQPGLSECTRTKKDQGHTRQVTRRRGHHQERRRRCRAPAVASKVAGAQAATGWGDCQRRLPTGGLANGTPRKLRAIGVRRPSIGPSAGEEGRGPHQNQAKNKTKRTRHVVGVRRVGGCTRGGWQRETTLTNCHSTIATDLFGPRTLVRRRQRGRTRQAHTR